MPRLAIFDPERNDSHSNVIVITLQTFLKERK